MSTERPLKRIKAPTQADIESPVVEKHRVSERADHYGVATLLKILGIVGVIAGVIVGMELKADIGIRIGVAVVGIASGIVTFGLGSLLWCAEEIAHWIKDLALRNRRPGN